MAVSVKQCFVGANEFAPTWLKMRVRPLAALLPLLIASGCALNPIPGALELQRETLAHATPPAAWTAGSATGAIQADWLSSFGDAQLAQLVDEALAHNPDMRVAAARVEQEQAQVGIAGGDRYPSVNLIGFDSVSNKSGGSSELSGWHLGASWELDLWGRVRYGVRATEYGYDAAAADARFARQSLAATVAKAWFLTIESALQRALALDAVQAAAGLLALAEERLRVGVGSALDVSEARASLRTTEDSARQRALAEQQAKRALELLLGRYPAAEIAIATTLPAMPPPAPGGMPAELLERRPDLIAAERRVAAAFDRIGEAKAARLPRLSLSADLSDFSSDMFVLQNSGGIGSGIGAGLLAPLFQGGALQAQVELREAERKQAAAQYAQTGLRAFSEVEDALTSEAALADREILLAQAVADNAEALALEEIRYKVGSGDLRSVNQQQLALNASRVNLLGVQSERRVQRVNLHLALGGGFETEAPPATAP